VALGLPNHLARSRVTDAIAAACHTSALLCLAIAALCVGVIQVDYPALILWPTFLALGVLTAALVLLAWHRTVFWSVAYLATGCASTFWYAGTLLAQLGAATAGNSYLLTLPKLALVLCAGAAVSSIGALGWVITGFAAAETGVLAAHLQAGTAAPPDFASTAVAVLLAAVLSTVAHGRRRSQRVRPTMHRAAREESVASMRNRLEHRAAALLHDTVLSQLAAIAAAPAGPLPAATRISIERDLQLLVGEDWLVEPEQSPVTAGDAHLPGPFEQALGDSERDGLVVELAGELGLLAALTPEVGRQLALAMRQCLVNVLRHSGTERAEVVVFGGEGELTVMVIDGGRGFRETSVPGDRLGLRESVRGRIERVGGSVQVWSTVGEGTSVLLRVPRVAAVAVELAADETGPDLLGGPGRGAR
jgi:signal transduction histidine kinase